MELGMPQIEIPIKLITTSATSGTSVYQLITPPRTLNPYPTDSLFRPSYFIRHITAQMNGGCYQHERPATPSERCQN